MTRPALFVGSSSEGLRIAKAIQVCLDPVCEVELWTQGTFGLTRGTLESLVLALSRFDFAILVLTADDMTTSRGIERASARDNVLLELGLFIGSLGRDRTFMVCNAADPPELLSIDMFSFTRPGAEQRRRSR
jgi:predicted nucleotide-binding protein